MIKSYFPIMIKISNSSKIIMITEPEDLPIGIAFVVTGVTLPIVQDSKND